MKEAAKYFPRIKKKLNQFCHFEFISKVVDTNMDCSPSVPDLFFGRKFAADLWMGRKAKGKETTVNSCELGFQI